MNSSYGNSKLKKHGTRKVWGKILFLFNLIIVTLLMLLPACSNKSSKLEVLLGQNIDLALNQRVSVTGESMEIKFLRVINDSRCPKGATCVWEGEANAEIEINYENSTNRLVLTQRGSDTSLTDFNNYEISYDLRPYPELGKTIDNQDYRLWLKVNERMALSDGILVTFKVIDETYKVFITNKETISEVFAVKNGTSSATIPSGRIIDEPIDYNQPWTWHIDSEDIHMAEITIELCDGRPSMVEENLDYWVNSVQRFCPWHAEIIKIEDFR